MLHKVLMRTRALYDQALVKGDIKCANMLHKFNILAMSGGGSYHFFTERAERINQLGNKQLLRFVELYLLLQEDRVRLPPGHRRWAIRFGGNPEESLTGNFLVIKTFSNGKVEAFLSVLVDQRVIEPRTIEISWKRLK